MRCKKHLPDVTSTLGVCASCLRERLQAVLDAEIKAQAQAQAQSWHRRFGKSDLNPTTPPPNFPRQRERLFDSTQQAVTDVHSACDIGTPSTKRKLGRFWILSNVFRSKSNKTENCELSSSVTPPSSTWLSAVLNDHRQNNGVTDRRKCRQSERGSSTGNNYLNEGQNRSALGYSSESSPRRAAMAARRSSLGPAGKSLASMALCLSPLVRASPNRHWNSHKGLSQEFSVGGTHQLSNAAAFCANRSRKLADFGRVVAYNR